jgi:hypothetical protein
MKLKPTSFYAIYKDGLVLTVGHSFSVKGRNLVVHKTRPALLPADKFYKVSELTAGFAVPIEQTLIRAQAVRFATSAMAGITDEAWANEIRRHLKIGKSLQVVEG